MAGSVRKRSGAVPIKVKKESIKPDSIPGAAENTFPQRTGRKRVHFNTVGNTKELLCITITIILRKAD
jgi:hypothetical protein